MWFNLNCHSHFSLLTSTAKPKQIAERCKELGMNGCALVDSGNLSGAIQFIKAMHKEKLKWILGCEIYLCKDDPSIKNKENSFLTHLTVLAKNLDGWKSLVGAVNESNKPEYFYKKPRLNLDKLAQFAGNIIIINGGTFTDLGNCIFGENVRAAYNARTYDEAKKCVVDDWVDIVFVKAIKYREMFGKENFFLEISLMDQDNLPATKVIAEALRHISQSTEIPCVATAPSYYCKPEDAADQRILLCSKYETTLRKIQKKLDNDDDISLSKFFHSNQYYMPSMEEMGQLHTQDEIENSLLISDMCEDYNVFSQPLLPRFACPDRVSEVEHLRQLCREGWKKKIGNNIDSSKHPIYVDRIKKELAVLEEANLSGYFLIVQDYVEWAHNNAINTGSRGSAAGCLVSYLLNITDIDPIRFDLIFERFYNAGRNTKDRVALPDIDVDFPKFKRSEVINYIKSKYGENCVSHMLTFGRMQGRSALKDVLRAHDACSYEEMNLLTRHIPNEADISDQLQLMREQDGEASIIQWALENNKKELQPWCSINDGQLDGKFSQYFAQAIRLEGTKRNQGKHASGLVISANALDKTIPMVYDKSDDQLIAGLEMEDLESLGQVKFDILGITYLDKVMGVQKLLETGTI